MGLKVVFFPSVVVLGAGLLLVFFAAGCGKREAVQTGESFLLAENDFSEILVHTPNPDRGFLNAWDWNPGPDGPSPSLALYIMELANRCNDEDIRLEVGDLEAAIRIYRHAGKRMILRPIYSTRRGEPNRCGENHAFEPASLKIYQSHLEQLAPVLDANKDVVVFWQLGVLGPWGEWHGSGRKIVNGQSVPFHDNGELLQDGVKAWGDTPASARDKRLSVLKLTLEKLPEEMFVQVRRPVFRYEATRRYDGDKRWFTRYSFDKRGKPFTKRETITDSQLQRVGFFNDCFLASSDDWGTYNTAFGASHYPALATVSQSKAYVKEVSASVPMGGETCPALAGNRLQCAKAESEMSQLHWVYLSPYWWQPAIDGWREQGCFERIERSLGQRYIIEDVSAEPLVGPNGMLTVEVNIRNVGYAVDHRKRLARLVLEHQGSFFEAGKELKLLKESNTQASSWLPGRTTKVSQTVRVPKAPGLYYLRLAIRDPHSPRPEHAIRIASYFHGQDVWDQERGDNDLGVSVDVSGRCVRKTCEDLKFQCGELHDGCGQTLDCGSCAEGFACKTGKNKHVCVEEKQDKGKRFLNPSNSLERWREWPGDARPEAE